MKKKFLVICGGLIMALAAGLFLNNQLKQTDSAMLQNVEALARGEAGDYKKLMGNQAGDRYCCCPGGRGCYTVDCPSIGVKCP